MRCPECHNRILQPKPNGDVDLRFGNKKFTLRAEDGKIWGPCNWCRKIIPWPIELLPATPLERERFVLHPRD